MLSFSKSNSIKKTIRGLLPRQLVTSRLPIEASNNVLLTFDDGPHPEITPRVLNLLEKYGARAIFFIVGHRILRAPYLLKQIQERGHIIGNHTYIHSNKRQPWFFAYLFDLLRCQAIIEQYTGKRPKLFRPPGGRISFQSLFIPKFLGLITLMWSVGGEDWRCLMPKDARILGENLILSLAPRDIVLLHDDNQNVSIILEMILPFLQFSNLDLHSGIEFLNKKGL